MRTYEFDFLDRNQLRQMLSLFDAGKFVDGAISGPKDKEVKNNHQQEDIDINKMVNSGIAKILRESTVTDIHILNKASPCMLLRYGEGQHYSDHVDAFDMWACRTDFTCVINLNDDYEGGEHYIKFGDNVVESKLEPGKLLMYPTEYIHGVRPVTHGVRKCITFWCESSIHDQVMRYYLADLNEFYYNICDNLTREDTVKLDHIRMGLIRRSSVLRN